MIKYTAPKVVTGRDSLLRRGVFIKLFMKHLIYIILFLPFTGFTQQKNTATVNGWKTYLDRPFTADTVPSRRRSGEHTVCSGTGSLPHWRSPIPLPFVADRW